MAILELDNDSVFQDTDKTDLNNSCMLRAVLDKAATVDEAINIFNSYDIRDAFFCSYHYQITDATGKSVIIEYINDGKEMNLIYPTEKADTYKYQCLTNYYISYNKDHKAQKDCYGWDRMEILEDKLSTNKGIISEVDAMNLLDQVHLNVDMPGCLDTVVTVWSEIYNLTDKTVTICVAMDYTKSYTFSLNNPCQVLA